MKTAKSLRKITYITAHNWNTKRLGGFHKFAESTAKNGIETVFFSFPRPYYGLFMKREQLNKKIINTLKKGAEYNCGGGKVLNVTFPTFRLPDFVGKFLPSFFMKFMLTHSFRSFKRFCNKYLSETDCFVFESCEGIAFLDKLKKLFPNARMVYRPSDPMVHNTAPKRLKDMEKHILLNSDLTILVNSESLDAYRKEIPDFDSRINQTILSNGVDIEPYTKEYPVPDLLQKQNTFLYVGAWDVEWPLLFRAASETPNFNYIVVCPNYPPQKIQEKVEEMDNLFYVPGINPSEVPAWITNCSVVMVPYVTDFYKDRPIAITSKYYQAMAAKKPIIAYCNSPKLKDIGVDVTYSYEDFIEAVRKAMKIKIKDYSFDLQNCTWDNICKRFIELLETL